MKISNLALPVLSSAARQLCRVTSVWEQRARWPRASHRAGAKVPRVAFLVQPASWRRQKISAPCFERPWPVFCSSTPLTPPLWQPKDPQRKMRQLRGKPKKETSKDKKERKQAMQEARQQITTVVLPTLAVVVLLIVVFVYVATRPNTTEWCSVADFLPSGYSCFYQEPKETLCHSWYFTKELAGVFGLFSWLGFHSFTLGM